MQTFLMQQPTMTATLPQQQPPQHGQFVPFVPQQWTQQQQQQQPPPQLVQSNPGGVPAMYPLASAPGQPMLYVPSNDAANSATLHGAPATWQSVPQQAFPGAVTYIVAPTPQPATHQPQQHQAIFVPSQQAVAVARQAPVMAHGNALPPALHRHHIDRGGRGPARTSPGGAARPRTMPAPPQIGPGERPERYKTAICRHATKGRCLRGVACRFAHGDADLRTEEQNKAAGLTTFDAVEAVIAAAEASERKSTAAVMNTITTHNNNIHHPTSNNAAMPAATAVEVKHTADAENYQHYVAIQAPPAMATSALRSTPSATSSTSSSTPVHAPGTSGTSVDASIIMNSITPTPQPFGAIAAFP